MRVYLEIRNLSICLFFSPFLLIYLLSLLLIYLFIYLLIYCNFPALKFVQDQDLRLAVDSFGQHSSVMLRITSGALSFISFP